ncbi:hypothetical protein J1N35_005831 [Gossypium stocksii]|uniref:Uncharacterized protein n=1 Tax=Gossypium stocksii TaxID=47602 RepID=A0A9D3WFQ1_9ROSI|nr:hypothetical protein J1N35_005831 [Gossypium stocksii]
MHHRNTLLLPLPQEGGGDEDENEVDGGDEDEDDGGDEDKHEGRGEDEENDDDGHDQLEELTLLIVHKNPMCQPLPCNTYSAR